MGLKVKKCKECAFWNKSEHDSNIGECRGGFPTVFVVAAQDILGKVQSGTFSSWPVVDGDKGWCGKGEPLPENIN